MSGSWPPGIADTTIFGHVVFRPPRATSYREGLFHICGHIHRHTLRQLAGQWTISRVAHAGGVFVASLIALDPQYSSRLPRKQYITTLHIPYKRTPPSAGTNLAALRQRRGLAARGRAQRRSTHFQGLFAIFCSCGRNLLCRDFCR